MFDSQLCEPIHAVEGHPSRTKEDAVTAVKSGCITGALGTTLRAVL